jgi:neutral ceramidase
LLANYSLHYVGGVPAGHISADYFGAFATRLAERLEADKLDPPFVGIMSNGTSGNINNIDFQDKNPPRWEPYEKIHVVANLLADKVFAAMNGLQYHDRVTLDAACQDLALAVRLPTPEQLARAKRILADQEQQLSSYHARERIYAERLMRLSESPSEVSVPLQVFRIGELAITAIPFEVFVETGLEIKQQSPFAQTFTIELANGSFGYLPTPEHHALGGYETWLGTSNVEVQASEKISRQLLDMLQQAHRGAR